ncbi:DUF262 domain-containing protein [Corallococcus carmarthensis]|uniref:DUF262 domain-containing protein n=1 Tax=Corallococcus carmarthensis TaxID=2316728 RepID=UPI00148B4BEA|nr:DUF262 domain-containing protein [Corallococcus carmarthensis]NOK18830.1 DUF262 domain-containing protein [Corallococcus carmarthensis]
MTTILNRESNTITIANFWENHLLGKYNFNPPYQRHSVWTDDKQSFFIDSILRNFPVPPIFLHQHIDDTTGRTMYDVIDGKQRLTSLIRFIENKIPVSNEFNIGDTAADNDDHQVAGAYFRDLDNESLSDYKKRFWRYVLPIEYVDTTSTEIIDDIFDRLNRNGEPLTGQELRNARYHGSELIQLVQRLAKTPFWRERLEHVDLARMENYEFISELLFVMFEDGPLEAHPRIVDNLYEKYSQPGVDWIKAEKEFHEITKFLGDLNLDYEQFKIKGVSHLYGLWCFSWYCRQNSVPPQKVEKKLKALFDELRSGTIKNSMVKEYKKTMGSNTKSRLQRANRLDALLQYCGV